ncbi:MAG TPA: tRNA lysidine(34) synthetase TilS [Xanthobacteraceae bacterium]|nr:tRNA lysidine(34) synthetase TilS [Xanthobacteraceae bacterium]
MSIADGATAIAEREIAQLFAAFPRSGRVILAVSGGADSTALMVLARRWRRRRAQGPQLIAATVDHGLRPGSRAEARAVGILARRLGLRHELLRWRGERPATGIEAAARRVRYRLLAELAQRLSAEAIATAHTLDDQAETVLMRLAAGSGPAGLAGMRPRDLRDGVVLLRPFLGVRKARLVATLRRAKVAWAEDPMNVDPAFARPRLRAAAGVLVREGLTPERMGRLAERMARYEEVVAAATQAARASLADPRCPGRLDGRALLAAPQEVALRLLAGEIAACGPLCAKEKPLRLQRLEALWDDLRRAIANGRSTRRTLGGALIAVDRDQSVLIGEAPARRAQAPPDGPASRGRRKAAKDPFTKGR